MMYENGMTDAELRMEMTRTAYNRYLRYGVATNALLSDTNPIAGYLLPEEFETKLTDAMNSIGVIRSLCTEVKTSVDRIMPIVNGHGQPQWVPEGGTIPMVRDTFDRVVLDSHVLAATIRVTSELLKESAIDIEQYLADSFADRMAPAEEEAFIAGDGVDKPLGLIHQAKVGCESQTVGVVSIEDVLNLIFSVPERHHRNGVLLMNEQTLLELYKQCMSQGTNLWFGRTNDGKDDTIFGYRIVRCSAMPSVESGNTPILFGDFKKVYINECGNAVFLMNTVTMNKLRCALGADAHDWITSRRDGSLLLMDNPVMLCNAMPFIRKGSVPMLFGDFSKVSIKDCGCDEMQQEPCNGSPDRLVYTMTGYMNCVLEDKQAIWGLKII